MQSPPNIPPETVEESEQVNLLLEMLGDSVNRAEALRVYRKHKGNMERAADAILSGDRGEDYNWEETPASAPPGYSQAIQQQIRPQPLKPSNTVIDLTGSDDELQRAMALSLETETQFGPSNRTPDVNWAMVPTNQLGDNTGISNEEKSYNDAIQASLEDLVSTNESDFLPIEAAVREGGRPVAFRSNDPTLAYAALFIQALFFVPQVRERVASIQLPIPSDNLPDPRDSAMRNLMELFVNLDLAQLSAIMDSEILPSLMAQSQPDYSPVGDATADFLKSVSDTIEDYLKLQSNDEPPRLFNFTHGHIELHRRIPKQSKRAPSDSHIVLIEFGGETTPYTDLISCLSGTLSKWTDTGSSHDVIIEPSDVFCFHVRRAVNQEGKFSPEPFSFPKYIYLDQFLLENLELANETRLGERKLLDGISELTRMKEGLTQHNNRDIMKDLEDTLYYYENVAQAEDNLERTELLKKTKTKLRDVIANISRKIEAIDYKIEKLQAEVMNVYNIPELQQHRYDLRAVLIHTGLPGRKHKYSYVHDNQGVWWKIVDYTVTEVSEETIFSDTAGLHLGAGPYMLIYSRHVEIEDLTMPQWPRKMTEMVEKHNKTFLDQLPPEVAAKVQLSTIESPPPSSSSAAPSPPQRAKSD
ncbi:hypothetical protein AGABI2DRAFT_226546 [Agaricus bisporus var. bisporus H97]|uniref:hypothetical protein n=1 Tax=Agaricus bisporus var. bisporus (strain H97 / ATCC MYA-4626 / FGSC 10389) TaxID=936046 RepID=UPI00029F7292|nr:hypothetical protein AGABI2DRAFT_226546 [Agaricus bisporus var. bisporus H97]EKV43916.1 hypothetical protein AGABI2DRAFT_226546 [Agaricus bisporus var. bisporus H97]